jgi:hypothetical protein
MDRERGYAPARMADQQTPAELPPYVVTEADRTRWTNAGEAARGALGPDADAEQVWSAQRVIFHDRETYKD